jgi:hypothetical protein
VGDIEVDVACRHYLCPLGNCRIRFSKTKRCGGDRSGVLRLIVMINDRCEVSNDIMIVGNTQNKNNSSPSFFTDKAV